MCACVTHSLQALETWAGTVYLQSMIMVRVSLSLASWKGGWPHTNMKRITPRLQISEAEGNTNAVWIHVYCQLVCCFNYSIHTYYKHYSSVTHCASFHFLKIQNSFDPWWNTVIIIWIGMHRSDFQSPDTDTWALGIGRSDTGVHKLISCMPHCVEVTGITLLNL